MIGTNLAEKLDLAPVSPVLRTKQVIVADLFCGAGSLSMGDAAGAPRGYAESIDVVGGSPSFLWPWERDWWRPQGFRRDLVKAAALLLAEGERFDRNRTQGI